MQPGISLAKCLTNEVEMRLPGIQVRLLVKGEGHRYTFLRWTGLHAAVCVAFYIGVQVCPQTFQ